MKKFIGTVLFICLTVTAFAQQRGKLTMSVIDAQTREGIAGAVVEMSPAGVPDGEKKYYTSGFGGKTEIPNLKYGEYDVVITFLGYDDLKKSVKVDAAAKDLGAMEMAESATKIEAVVKEVQAIRASQKGDTVSYNAEAYKVANDADVEGLLKKMPGITITNGSESVNIHDRYERIAGAQISKERNAIDSMAFTIYPDNPGYALLDSMTTTIQVRNGKTGRLDFDGRVVKAPGSMDGNGLISKAVLCEGVEAYLCDSTQPYLAERQWSGGNGRTGLQEFIDYVLARHNERVEPHKRVYRGNVDLVTYETTGGVYKGLQRDTTRETLFGKLVDVFGGEMRVRRNEADGLLYLDYSKKLGRDRETPVEVARNMASVSMDEDTTQVITRLYPLGAKLEDSEDRITVASVNGGRQYIDDADALAKYGILEGTQTWDDVTQPANLLSAARSWLAENNLFPHSAAVSVYDLSLIDKAPDELSLLDWYPCRNHLVGLDEPLEIIKQTIDINEPHASSVDFGNSTAKQSSQATAALASKVAQLEKMLGL